MPAAMTLECERCGKVIPMIERNALGWFIDFSRGFLCAPCAGAEDPNRGFVCHVHDDVNAVYIGRAVPRQGIAASPWGNPFRTEYRNEESRMFVVRLYAESLAEKDDLSFLIPLRGKALACWCRHIGQRKRGTTLCHGDVILWYLDRYTDEELADMGTRPRWSRMG